MVVLEVEKRRVEIGMISIRRPIHTYGILAKEWESEIDPSFLTGIQQRETLVHHESHTKEGACIITHTLDSATLPAVFVVVGGEVQLHCIVAVNRIVFSGIYFEFMNAFVAFGYIVHQVVQFPTIIRVEGAEQMRLAP